MKLIPNTTDLKNIDCHLHSRFSPDARSAGAASADEIADLVRKKNLRGFIVTDHLDVGHWNGYIIDFDKYFKEWERVRRENPDLTIYIGLEVGFEEKYAKATNAIVRDLPLDYIVNSVHYYETSGYGSGKSKIYSDYLEAVIASLDAPYEFSTVGHLGYVERYAPYPDGERAMSYDEFKPLLDIIIKRAIERGVRFEENTNAGGKMITPRKDFFTAYARAGGARPVVGSDSHTPDTIGNYFESANDFLAEIFD